MRTGPLIAMLVFLTIFSTYGGGQAASTSLHGTVEDASGAVVAGAKVALSNPETGFLRVVETDSQGIYQFLKVPPATYTLSVEAQGFAIQKRLSIVLLVGTPTTLNLTTQVASQQTTVEVTTESPLVNTQDASLGHAFNTYQIENLPFEGRNPTEILSLQPGVAYTGNNSAAITPFIDSRSGSVAGGRSDQANITIDGVDNNDPVLGISFEGVLRATLDSLQEFRVTTAGGTSDEGRSSGAQIVLVTKSGTNKFHGSIFEYHRPTFTTANDWFIKNSQLQNGEKNIPPKLIRNTFGASLGGPLTRNRLFFFGSYEGQRLRENTTITRVVPSMNLRSGIVTYQCDNGSPRCPPSGIVTLSQAQLAALDPNCSTPQPGFPQGTCPLGPGANPSVMQLFQDSYPAPNNTNVGDGFNYVGFTFAAPAPQKFDTYILKLDYNVAQNGNQHVFLRGNLQNDHVAGTGSLGPAFPGAPPELTFLSNNKGIAAGYTAVLQNNLINSFHYGFIREGNDAVGLQTQHFVDFRGLDGPFAESPTTRVTVPMNNFVDDLTWTKGNHALGFGTNIRIINDARAGNGRSFFGASTNVSWLFGSGISNTGQSLDPCAPQFAGLNLPCVSTSFTQSYDLPVAAITGLTPFILANYNLTKTLTPLPEGSFVPRHFRAHEGEWYLQDEWRIRPTLTVTAGLRYTLLQPPYEVTGTQVAPDTSLNEFFNLRGQMARKGEIYEPSLNFSLSGQANGKKPYWEWDFGNIAPRLAFAWSPSAGSGWLKHLLGGAGKTSIRGGYGMYYDHFGEGIVNSFDRLGSFGLSTSVSLPANLFTTDTSPRFSTLNTIPTTAPAGCALPPCSTIPAPPQGSFPVTPSSDPFGGGFSIYWGLDDKLKTPYSHVVSFSITRELPKKFVLETAYVGRFAHRLLQEDDLAMPLNLADPKSGMDYFTAAQMLAKANLLGVPIQSIGTIPYWQNLYPKAAGPAATQILGCAPGVSSLPAGANVTATQAIYGLFACTAGNETFALSLMDLPQDPTKPDSCFPACATINGVPHPFAFFDPQFSSLYGWRSIGNSNYNGLQISLRKRMSGGLTFDMNYTYSKSIDLGSNAERINQAEGGGFASQVINAWAPSQLRAVSDFDTTHQTNANWVYDLPLGRGKSFGNGMGGILNALFEGWQISGLWRWSSGFPFTVAPGLGFWSTNWELTSSAVLIGARPKTGTFIVPTTPGAPAEPNVFQAPSSAASIFPSGGPFRLAFPGESGQRNNLRGPGTFDIDMGLGKTWSIVEEKKLTFRWETYNVTNTPRFDVGTLQNNGVSSNNNLSVAGTFGQFVSTLNKPRLMQFALRFDF